MVSYFMIKLYNTYIIMYVINYFTICFISVLSLANILTDLEWFKGIQYLYLPIKNLKNRSIHPGTLFRYELGVVPSHIGTPSTGSGYLSVKIFLILKKKNQLICLSGRASFMNFLFWKSSVINMYMIH